MATDRTMRQDPSTMITAVLNVLIGIWLFVSPWIYGAAANGNAWNTWIAGALIALFGIIRASNPRVQGLAWLNMVLGAWVFISPWVYGYTVHTGRGVNSLCAGAAVFLLAAYAAFHREHTPIAGTPVR